MESSIVLSIVVPVYNEEKNIPIFLERMANILAVIGKTYEIIFALDPSTDKSREVILNERTKDSRIKLLTFSRRVGQPMATMAGLQYAKGNAVVVIDVDLQDPPELVNDMVKKWQEGFDVVYAQRITRKGETLLKRIITYWGYKFINKIADVNIPPNTGDFRLMSRRVVEEIVKLKETHGFLRGLVALVGFKQTAVRFDRLARYSGAGNYNKFFGSLKIGLNGIVCFSNYLLGLSSLMGFVSASIAMLFAIIYLMLKLMGFPFPLGNPTIVIIVLFLGGIQLISVGILGEYIGRIYDEVKQRPKFILDEAHGIEF
jgi:dolichol-phosphate mannosyltransferase